MFPEGYVQWLFAQFVIIDVATLDFNFCGNMCVNVFTVYFGPYMNLKVFIFRLKIRNLVICFSFI